MLKLSLDLNNVPKLYSGVPDNIIRYIRTEHPDPRHPIQLIVEDSSALDWNSLQQARIYQDTPSTSDLLDMRVPQFYMPVNSKDLRLDESDLGLSEKVSTFRENYALQSTSQAIIMLDKGATLEVYKQVLDYLKQSEENITVIYPTGILEKILINPNTVYVEDIINGFLPRHKSGLIKSDTLLEQLQIATDKIKKQGNAGLYDIRNTVPSDLQVLLYTALVTRDNMFPQIRPRAYFADLIKTKLIYPLDILSLYERLSFMRKLTNTVGYISRGLDTVVPFRAENWLFEPESFRVFDMETCEEESSESFKPLNTVIGIGSRHLTPIINPKELFSQNNALMSSNQSPVINNITDVWDNPYFQLNLDFTRKFRKMDSTAPISFKNSVPFIGDDGRLKLAYIPYSFALGGSIITTDAVVPSVYSADVEKKNALMVVSPLTLRKPIERRVIDESDFNRLVGFNYALAMDSVRFVQHNSESIPKAAKLFKDIGGRWSLSPAIPIEETLVARLCDPRSSNIDFFDMMLREFKNVFPLPTKDASEMNKSILDYISLQRLSKGLLSSNYITCCGTLIGYPYDGMPKLPLTYKEFGEVELYV